MAEHAAEHKEVKKDAPESATSINPLKILNGILFALGTVVLLFLAFYFIFQDTSKIAEFTFYVEIFEGIVFVIILYLFFLWYGYMRKFQEQTHKIQHIYEHKYKPVVVDKNALSENMKKFEQAKAHMTSTQPLEWRIGIIELDNLLRDLLKKAGYAGNTVAELLESAKEKGFAKVDEAWNAHKVRNKIAHDGFSFDLQREEADRTFRFYKITLEELKIS